MNIKSSLTRHTRAFLQEELIEYMFYDVKVKREIMQDHSEILHEGEGQNKVRITDEAEFKKNLLISCLDGRLAHVFYSATLKDCLVNLSFFSWITFAIFLVTKINLMWAAANTFTVCGDNNN